MKIRKFWVTRDESGSLWSYNIHSKRPGKYCFSCGSWDDHDMCFSSNGAEKILGLDLPPGGGPRAAVMVWADEWDFQE